MRKTHKKILGFTGLGLVAAVTTVAAVLPTPMAKAVSSITDTIQVRVISDDSDITISTTSAGEITSPEYAFDVAYSTLVSLKITVSNYDSEGNLIKSTIVFDRDDLDYESGVLPTFELNLDNFGGRGHYVITAEGVGHDGTPIEKMLEVVYKSEEGGSDDGGEVNPEPGDSEVDVDADIPTVEVETIAVEVYDKDGDLVKGPIIYDNPTGDEEIDLSDLPDGEYTVVIISRDEDNNVIKKEVIDVVVDKDAGDSEAEVTIEDHGEDVVKAEITVTDKDGNIVKDPIVINNPTPGDKINVDLDGLEDGDYNINVDYYDGNGNKVGGEVIPVTKTDDGKISIKTDKEVDVVTQIEIDIYDEDGNLDRVIIIDRETGTAYVYDKDGNLLYTIPDAYKDGKILIDLDGLASGNYTAVITYKDANGKTIGNTKTVKIKYEAGKAIIVPDTGSFFQGLNISRQDYLITGIIVFTVIGVVAFGIVKRNHNTKKFSGKNRR
ncbi:hypothetical protein IJ076_00990 [Candidatus Saccharibacteria bacterium]|nr:hypothetical protein [Candidatus Saccharibacteria bacterium]